MPDHDDSTSDRQFYFLHVPKTAGTSLRSIIEGQFASVRICPTPEVIQGYGGNYPPIRYILEIPQDEFDRYELVRGHYFYNMVERFSRTPLRVTMLRKPKPRTISFLRHAMRNPNLAETSINDLLANENFVQKYLRDYQVKLLALELDNSDPEKVPVDTNVPLVSGPKMLERAKAVLDEFEFVGLAEHFDESVELMAARFGWTVPEAAPALNRSPRQLTEREELSDESLEIIREATQLDEELYEHAVGVFQKMRDQAVTT